MKPIDKTLKYYELLMSYNNLDEIPDYKLPKDYKIIFYKDETDIEAWINIHINSGELTSKDKAREYFFNFYSNFLSELPQRLFFIVDANDPKIATSTISKCEEYGYKCVIDWLAIDKNFQGKGLAKPLISQSLSLAKKLGYNKIMLHTQTHTWLAAKLYLDLGFSPMFVGHDLTGWKILKTITNHSKLTNIDTLPQNEIHHQLTLNIVKQLNKLHINFDYEVWYKNNQNDVYVNDGIKLFIYKFYDNGNVLKLVKECKN